MNLNEIDVKMFEQQEDVGLCDWGRAVSSGGTADGSALMSPIHPSHRHPVTSSSLPCEFADCPAVSCCFCQQQNKFLYRSSRDTCNVHWRLQRPILRTFDLRQFEFGSISRHQMAGNPTPFPWLAVYYSSVASVHFFYFRFFALSPP